MGDVQIYEMRRQGLTETAKFESAGLACALGEDSLYRAAGSRVECCNFQGIVKQTLAFDAAHGACTHVDANGEFLAAVTDAGVLKLWKTSGREAKPHGPLAGRTLELASGEALGTVESVRINAAGTKVRCGQGNLHSIDHTPWALTRVVVSQVLGYAATCPELNTHRGHRCRCCLRSAATLPTATGANMKPILLGVLDSTQRVSNDPTCWTFHSRVAVYDMDSDMVCTFDFATIQVCHLPLLEYGSPGAGTCEGHH